MITDQYIDKAEKEIIVWTRNNFPIEYGLNRISMMNFNELMQHYVADLIIGNDVYGSVFSRKNIAEKVYDTIFIDVDNGYECFRKVVSKLMEYDIRARYYFSGRGYHIYIDFRPIVLNDYSKCARDFIKEIGIDTMVDMCVIGDVRRMARMPLTINTKTGCYMIPIFPYMNESMIHRTAKTPDNVLISGLESSLQKNSHIISMLLEYDRDTKKDFETPNIEINDLPECIKTIIKKAITNNYINHQERLHLATYLLSVNKEKELYSVLSILSDFDPKYSIYQVEWLKNKNYSPYSCRAMMKFGLCPNKCKLFPYILKEVK